MSSNSINSLTSSASLSATNSALDLSNILTTVSGSSSTGIDVNAAVAAALYADRAPERIWQADQVTLTSQTNALTQIQTATESLYWGLESFNTFTGPLSTRTVTSSNSSYITATAANGTAAGTHSIVVNNLATKGSWYSDLETSPTTILPMSSLTITDSSGKTYTFATGSNSSGDNLNNLAKAINSADAGVTATVVSDSTGSRLAIVSTSSGAAAGFSVTSPSFSGTSWSSPTMPTGSSLGADSIKISSGTASITVPTTNGETYAQLADAINAAVYAYNADPSNSSAPLNVTASAGSNAQGTNLSLSSSDDFNLNQPAFSFTQASVARDASLTIDGVPVLSASNLLTGIIPGVTLNLVGSSFGTAVNLTVASDSHAISQVINQFVTDYNTAINLVNSQFKMTSSTDSEGNTTTGQGVLASDSTVRSLQSAMEQALGYLYRPESGTTAVSSLADLGIMMQNDGTLSVNSATLTNVLTNSPGDVQDFFQGAALNGFASNYCGILHKYTSAANGAFKVDLTSINAQNTALSKQINDFETGYIASQQAILSAEFSKAEAALQSMNQTMQQLNALLGFNVKGS